MDIISIFSAVLGGVGGIAQKYMDHKQKIEELKFKSIEADKDRDHEKAILSLEMQKLDKQGQFNLDQKQLELQGQIEDAASRLQISSLEADVIKYSLPTTDSPWLRAVDVVRGLTRPGLTVFLTISFSLLCFYLIYRYGALIEKNTVSLLVNETISDLRLATITAVFWWFGQRLPSRRT